MGVTTDSSFLTRRSLFKRRRTNEHRDMNDEAKAFNFQLSDALRGTIFRRRVESEIQDCGLDVAREETTTS